MKLNKLGAALKSFDLFGKGVSFEIEGRSTKATYLGALISLTIIIITISYAARRFEIMKEYNDTTYQETTTLSNYTPEQPLTYEQTGFDFAISIKDVDSPTPYFIDIDPYLNLSVTNFEIKKEDGSPSGPKIEHLSVHRCTEGDIESRFSSYSAEDKAQLLTMYCLDDPS